MTHQAELFERVKKVKAAHQEMLMEKANVVGVGIGFAKRGQESTNQLSLVVMVSQKLAIESLETKDIIPHELEGIPVDVQEVGKLRAMA
jgi:hypothetical protein